LPFEGLHAAKKGTIRIRTIGIKGNCLKRMRTLGF
jgi:hypothetical protein